MGKTVVVIGGGAAGFFSAINIANKNPTYNVIILEKTSKLLSKVKISGGGRCNVTNNPVPYFKFVKQYPRGEKFLESIFKRFSADDILDWFSKKGVDLKIEEDGRVFPVSNSSQSVIDCFLREINKLNIEVKLKTNVLIINNLKEYKFNLVTITDSEKEIITCDAIVVATGGHSNISGYEFLQNIGHKIINPIPSLFTFNDKNKHFADLMGLSVSEVEVKIEGTKFSYHGPLLITHWGLSGPAVIKLSAFAATYLAEKKYIFNVLVNWLGGRGENDVRMELNLLKQLSPKQSVYKNPKFDLPKRLWQKMCNMAEISEEKIFVELSNKQINVLTEYLVRCRFEISGKTTFKEEFVTCGGVDLNEIDASSMESKIVKGVFFAGEVINVDGVTGGYNFQAAWSTAWVVSESI